MALSVEQMNEMMDRHFAYEAADDVDGVLTTLTDDVEHDIVGAPTGPTIGPDPARHFYEQLFADLTTSETRTVRRLHGENFLVDESLWRGTAAGHPFGIDGRGRPLEFRLLHVLEFSDDGRIRRENVWLDFPAIMRQLADS